MGKVYLVGAGPGDPGLLTLRAASLLRRANVVAYDALVNRRILELVPPGAELVYVGKRRGEGRTPQEEINRLLVEAAGRAEVVVRLKGGDPFVFGRGGEEAAALRAAGVPFEVVPGITAGIGALAYAGIPVTHRELASAVTFITAHEDPRREEGHSSWEHVARLGGTVVVYMGMANLDRVVERLLRGGRRPDTPAAVIEWGTWGQQRTVTASLDRIAERARAAGLGSPAVVVVGEVVGLREQIRWFEEGPLRGRRVVVARTRAQPSRLAAAFERLGAEVIEFPGIRVLPPTDPARARESLATLAGHDWIVFTSVTDVERFWAELRESGRDARALGGARVACFGAATAAAMERRGIFPDVRTTSYDPPDAAAAMGAERGLEGARVLFVKAEGLSSPIAERLVRAGAILDEAPLYRLEADLGGLDALRRRVEEGAVDLIAFPSSSSVAALAGLAEVARGRTHVAAIGPSTAAAARRAGFEVDVAPHEHTLAGLVRAALERLAVDPEARGGNEDLGAVCASLPKEALEATTPSAPSLDVLAEVL